MSLALCDRSYAQHSDFDIGQDIDQELAYRHISAAFALYEKGTIDIAARLLEKSFTYSDVYSDGWHLRALLSTDASRQAIYWNGALERNRWTLFMPSDAIAPLADYHSERGDYGRVVELLELPYGALVQLDQKMLAVYANALLRTSRPQDAQNAAAQGIVLYPQDARFWRIRLQDRQFLENTSILDIERQISNNETYLSIALSYIENTPPSARPLIIENYISRGGRDPRLLLFIEPENVPELLQIFPTIDDLEIIEYLIELTEMFQENAYLSPVDSDLLEIGPSYDIFSASTDSAARIDAPSTEIASSSVGAADVSVGGANASVGGTGVSVGATDDSVGSAELLLAEIIDYQSLADDLRDQLEQRYGGFSGVIRQIGLDDERVEQSYQLSEGSLSTWDIFSNSQYRDTYRITMIDRQATALIVAPDSDNQISFEYANYPYLSQAIYRAEDGQIARVLFAAGTELDLIQISSPQTWGDSGGDTNYEIIPRDRIVQDRGVVQGQGINQLPGELSSLIPDALMQFQLIEPDISLDREWARQNASRIDYFSSIQTNIPEKIEIVRGGITRFELYDTNGSGYFDYIAAYDDAFRRREWTDADHDNIHEIFAEYNDGALIELAIGDSGTNYRYVADQPPFYLLDLDQDGYFDRPDN